MTAKRSRHERCSKQTRAEQGCYHSNSFVIDVATPLYRICCFCEFRHPFAKTNYDSFIFIIAAIVCCFCEFWRLLAEMNYDSFYFLLLLSSYFFFFYFYIQFFCCCGIILLYYFFRATTN